MSRAVDETVDMTVELSRERARATGGRESLVDANKTKARSNGDGQSEQSENARAVDKTAHTKSESEEGAYGRTMCGSLTPTVTASWAIKRSVTVGHSPQTPAVIDVVRAGTE